MIKDNFIYVLSVDDDPIHCHVLGLICANIPLIVLNSVPEFGWVENIPPDLILIHLNHQKSCVRHLLGLSADRFPDVPIIGYLHSFNADALSDYSEMISGSFILMTYQEILLQLKEYISLFHATGALQESSVTRSDGVTTDFMRFKNLSPREKDVFCLMGKGLSSPEIAEMLHCSPRTVETHQRKIGYKLNVSGQFEIRRMAFSLMRGSSCHVLSRTENHYCDYIGDSIGHCPYLKAQ
ncbi:helix-turn-helix transcriptional regulator [Verrucomicrobia bacterium S94]|nr:helix-turn-helix transcriptional regulator [Verrucomicrobia bacterium S94]